MNKSLKPLLLAGLLAVSATVNAMTVFDPTNYKVNNIAAYKAVSMELESIRQTTHQAAQLYTMYQQLKTLNPAAYAQEAKDAATDLATMQAYQFATENVSKALGEQGDFITKLQTNYVFSGYHGHLSDYVQVLARRAAAGDLSARQMFDLATRTGDAVAAASQRRNELLKQNSTNVGLQQSAQTTNQYLDVLVSQNQNIQLLLAEQVKLLAEQKAKQSVLDQADAIKAKDASAREKQELEAFPQRWKVQKH